MSFLSTQASAPSGHLESGAIATGNRLSKSLATIGREVLAGGRLPPLRRLMYVRYFELVPASQPPISPLKGGQGAAMVGSAGRGAYRRVRDAARYGVAWCDMLGRWCESVPTRNPLNPP